MKEATKKKVVILGGGPNRIGQGIEFDYCCCHAAFALKEEGIESIMVNCNPETVSTDFDTSDRLYFEPLTLEDVLNIVHYESPLGVIVQFGGQTPLNLSRHLTNEGVNILGTSVDSIDTAEDRDKFRRLINKLKLEQPPSDSAFSFEEAKKIANKIGYPILVRPSYVLGGRAMEIVYAQEDLENFIKIAAEVSGEHPVLIDKFLEDAVEVDVDAISDGTRCVIGGIMEHIEEAGIHSGDSAMCLPPYSLSKAMVQQIKKATYLLAEGLHVKGLINIQFAVKRGTLYVLEVNPRASRTIPFVSKTIGVPLAKLATKIMVGRKLGELGFTKELDIPHVAVKESVFPFVRFPGVDIILGPEMKSTGEVMGIDKDFGRAYLKSQIGAYQFLPREGNVFISVKDKDKNAMVKIAQQLRVFGFKILATEGTGKVLKDNGIDVTVVPRLQEGRPNILDYMKNKEVHLIINTPSGKVSRQDESLIRSTATLYNIPVITTVSGAIASAKAIEMLIKEVIQVKSLQEYHAQKR